MTGTVRPIRPDLLPPGVDEPTVFRSLFASYPDALLLVDQAGLIVMANPSAARLLDYTVDELAGMSVDTLVPDNIRPGHARDRAAYAQALRPRPMGAQMDLVAKRRDGGEVRVEIALSPLQDAGLPLVVAAIRDIGTYPRVKQALQRARYSEHLANLGRIAVDSRDPQSVLDQVPRIAREALQVDAAVVYLLQSGRQHIVAASGAGALAEEAVGQPSPHRADTLPGYVIEQGLTVFVKKLAAESRFEVSRRDVEAGIVCALAVPVSDRSRVIGAIVVLSRETQRFGDDEARFLESLANLLATTLQRSQTEEALNHSQRLETVGQLTGGIAHDFNNLLTVIQGNLQVLEESPAHASDASNVQLVGAALRATRRAAELTGKLLAFSRRQVLQPMAVDVGAMLASLADMLRRTLDQRILIEVELRDQDVAVLADAGQLESALLNIAINARDAMPAGGTLRFRAEVCAALPAQVRGELGEGAGDGFVSLSVADSGSGMSDDVKERAFEPFFTTKEAGRGTGLGLSTVYGFVKQSRGAVSIDSAPDEGTCITLYLPRPAAAAAPVGDEADAAVPAGLRVLLVEDEPEVRHVARMFLEALGCVVTAVGGAEQGLRLLEPSARFDLLLSDIALGAGLRGTELAAQAQRRFPALGVLLMSGFSSDLLDADRDSPANWELLPKPFSRDDLARAIARITSGKPPRP